MIPYRLERKLGEGGMGEVYLAFDESLNRYVAIKRIRADKENDPDAKRRFLDEATTCSKLTHPAIIPIFTVHKEDPIYFAMPYIEGKMLKEILTSDHPLATIPSLLNIFLQICHACQYVHAKGIVHRDLKPSNIMIGANGEVTILDWGLAESIQQDAEKKHKIAGSIPYMAPELVSGMPTTYQSEVYSLGLILYEMLTFRFPFHRGSVEKHHESQMKELCVDPARVAPFRNIPPILSKITLKCLACAPQDRYQSVDELARDLKAYLYQETNWIEVKPPICVKNFKFVDYEKVDGITKRFQDGKLYSIDYSWLPEIASSVEPEEGSLFVRGKDLHPGLLDAADTLFTLKHYHDARFEYERIAKEYPFTPDGMQGRFMANLTAFMLHEAAPFQDIENPLDCLAKAIISEIESAHWIEYAFHHYPKHPLLEKVSYWLMTKLEELTGNDRYPFFLLAFRYLHVESQPVRTDALLSSFIEEIEEHFLFPDPVSASEDAAVRLAFWCNKPHIIEEIIEEMLQLERSPVFIIEEGFYALMAMGKWDVVQEKADRLSKIFLDPQMIAKLSWIQEILHFHKSGKINHELFKELPKGLTGEQLRPILFLLEEAILHKKSSTIKEIVEMALPSLSPSQENLLKNYQIWALLIDNDKAGASQLLSIYSQKELNETPMLGFYYGICHLSEKKWGKYIELFEKDTKKRLETAFFCQRRTIHLQAALLYHCFGQDEKSHQSYLLASLALAGD